MGVHFVRTHEEQEMPKLFGKIGRGAIDYDGYLNVVQIFAAN